MHELSIAGAIIDSASRAAAGRRVTSVLVRHGGLRQVVPDSLEFYWAMCTKGTAVEGARLELELVPTRLRCEPCATEWEPPWPVFLCGACGGAALVIAGEELGVESIEVIETEESQACIG